MSLSDEVAALLAAEPDCPSRVLRDELRRRGRASITTADIERLLRSFPRRFRPGTESPSRWRLAEAGEAAAPPPVSDASSGVQLYPWQADALAAWRARRGRGVVEAVTGTGKTMLGLVATGEELARGGQACVVVPTRELQVQWREALRRTLAPARSIGLLGNGHHDRLARHDVLVSVVNSARFADLRPSRPGGLLVADECHRYGSEGNRLALASGFERRLGLSATYARADQAHLTWLDPYFGGTCFRMGYRRAVDEGVTARFTVALVGVRFEDEERADYDEATDTMAKSAAQLIASGVVPAEPIGAFFEAVSRLAREGSDDVLSAAARRYLGALQARGRLLAETPAKMAALVALAPALLAADRVLVFTQSIAAAERASSLLRSSGLRAAAIHSGLEPSARRSVMDRFASGALEAVAAPQVLDEGVDVPAADVAVILAASRSRRQMIQRMGRILRRKPDGRRARFVVVFVEGTVEDPAKGAHASFLNEILDVADVVRAFPSWSPTGAITDFANRR